MKTLRSYQPHLAVQQKNLPVGGEWSPAFGGWCLIQVTSGNGYWLHPRLNRQLEPGVLLILSTQVRGSIRASQLGPGMVVHFSRLEPERLTGLFSLDDARRFESFAVHDRLSLQVFPPADPFAERFREMMINRTGRDAVVRLQLLKLFMDIFSGEMGQERPEPKEPLDAKGRLRQFLEQTPASDLLHVDFTGLVEITGCTARHLSRLFHEIVGMSFREKQAEIRLGRARELLATSESKVVDVALESGYQSLSLFNLMFKRRFGISPGKWREQAKSQKVRRNGARGMSVQA